MPDTCRRVFVLAGVTLLVALLAGCDTSQEERTIPTPVIPTGPVDQTPAWSPDGRYIAYHHDARWTEDSTDVTGLYILDLETETTRLLIEGGLESRLAPGWSPPGVFDRQHLHHSARRI